MTKKVHEASSKYDDDFAVESVKAALKEKSTEALVILNINNKKVKVNQDIGAEVTVMQKQIEDGHVKMEKTKTKLCGYVGTNILVERKIKVMREFRGAKQKSELHVAKTDSKAVLSLQTCRELEMTQILNHVTPKEGDKKRKRWNINGKSIYGEEN